MYRHGNTVRATPNISSGTDVIKIRYVPAAGRDPGSRHKHAWKTSVRGPGGLSSDGRIATRGYVSSEETANETPEGLDAHRRAQPGLSGSFFIRFGPTTAGDTRWSLDELYPGDLEPCAAVLTLGRGDLPPVRPRDLPHDTQPQSGAVS